MLADRTPQGTRPTRDRISDLFRNLLKNQSSSTFDELAGAQNLGFDVPSILSLSIDRIRPSSGGFSVFDGGSTYDPVMDADHDHGPVDLLAAIAQGDRAAFEHFYDRFVTVVFTLALRILGSRDDAEDLVQEVFLEVWHKASNYRAERGSPTTWLLTIARSRALDRLRREASTKNRALVVGQSAESTEGNSALEETVRNESASAIRSAIATLTDEQRIVLEMGFFDGLSQSRIASRLGLPLGTVKTRIRIGLRQIRNQLLSLGLSRNHE